MIASFFIKRKFDLESDRLGPDCPFTHWRLFFKKSMIAISKRKFKYFSDSAEFRSGAYAIACSKISIGKNVVIRPNTMLFADPRKGNDGSIIIEDDVMLGSGVHIYVGNHRFDLPNKNIIDQGHSAAKTVVLREGCWLGANCVILPGVTIGKNAVIGAGSIVTKSVPSNVVAAGNPARIIKTIR
ncbi:MAG: acyltransferase [Colwellia sp.]|uniref:acyltransferase n=1 Tax=Alteromonadales TaxID=135622 RepID=UPI001E12E032|nr:MULTISPECIES: acyltransferase [Alteromonadales]NQZ26990.1 acyltransferase [Colwellia sp.]NRA78647.1 acyltransferase [Pseudoalteromonas sp.]